MDILYAENFTRMEINKDSIKHVIWMIYLAITSSMTYFFIYGITTSVFVAQYKMKNYYTIAQMIGTLIGRILGAIFLPYIGKNIRRYVLIKVYILAIIPMIIFGFVSPIIQMILIFISAIPGSFIWGLVIFAVEGRRFSDIIIMIIYMMLIIGSGLFKTIGDGMLKAGISENLMPVYCSLISLVGGIIMSLLLYKTPEPTETEIENKQSRNIFTFGEQYIFFKKYISGLLPIAFVYGLLSSYRNYRNYYAVEILTSLIGSDFNSFIYTISEIIVSFIVIIGYIFVFFIPTDRVAFYSLIIIMIVGNIIIFFPCFLFFSSSPYFLFLWFILTGIGVSISTIPPGVMLYEKLMSTIKKPFSTVYLVYFSEIFSSAFTLILILSKSLIFYDVNFDIFFFYISIIFSLISCFLLGFSFISFICIIP